MSSLSVTHGNRDKRNWVCGIKTTGLGRWRNIFGSSDRGGFFQQYLIRDTEMPSVFYLPLLCKGSKARKVGCTTADPTCLGRRWACPSQTHMGRSRISILDQGSTPLSEVDTKWQLFIVVVFSLLASKRNRSMSTERFFCNFKMAKCYLCLHYLMLNCFTLQSIPCFG